MTVSQISLVSLDATTTVKIVTLVTPTENNTDVHLYARRVMESQLVHITKDSFHVMTVIVISGARRAMINIKQWSDSKKSLFVI